MPLGQHYTATQPSLVCTSECGTLRGGLGSLARQLRRLLSLLQQTGVWSKLRGQAGCTFPNPAPPPPAPAARLCCGVRTLLRRRPPSACYDRGYIWNSSGGFERLHLKVRTHEASPASTEKKARKLLLQYAKSKRIHSATDRRSKSPEAKAKDPRGSREATGHIIVRDS